MNTLVIDLGVYPRYEKHSPCDPHYCPRLPEAEQRRLEALWQSLRHQSDGGVNREQKP